jgi:hypothetical protein
LEAQQHKKYAQTTPLDDGVSSLSNSEFKVKLSVKQKIEMKLNLHLQDGITHKHCLNYGFKMLFCFILLFQTTYFLTKFLIFLIVGIHTVCNYLKKTNEKIIEKNHRTLTCTGKAKMNQFSSHKRYFS